MTITVAEQFVRVLRQAGVERVYGVVGDYLDPVADAIQRSDGIEWVSVRSEEAGAFAVAAEAQLTGHLAVYAGSCCLGNTRLTKGLFGAQRSGAPVLALATHIPTTEIGTSYFQETHPERLFTDCSHYCELISRPEQMPRQLRIAIQQALGCGDVAVLVLPGDVAHRPAARPTGSASKLRELDAVLRPPTQVTALAARLNAAQRVMLFCGAGVRDAHAEVLQLAGRLLAPVGHSLRGKEWIQFDNPYDVGMSGLLGYGVCDTAMHEADLVVMLGTDLPYDTFLPQTHTVQVDHDAARLGRRPRLELAIHGDIRRTVLALLPQLVQKTDRAFLDRMLHEHARTLERVVEVYTRNIEHHTPIHPEYAARILDELADDDAIFTVDTGLCCVWAARYLTPNGRRRVIGSFLHGSMANALPQAIGAQLAHPIRQVISLTGDGGLGMLLGELLTVRLHDLPIKIVTFNNAPPGMVKMEKLVADLPDFETDHRPVNYAAIAEAMGIDAIRVEQPSDVRSALSEALGKAGPVLVDVVTDPHALSIPPHIISADFTGFTLAATKIVLDGGVGRMLDMARRNLRNIPGP